MNPKYLLDTNICIYLIKHQSPHLLDKFLSIPIQELSIPSITVAELRYGADKSSYPEKNHSNLDEFLLPFTISEFTETSAFHYGKIRSYLEKKGLPIGSLDLLIAAIALSENQILVTNNLSEFKRVPGLSLENWVKK